MNPFKPRYKITTSTASALMAIESARQAIEFLPITPALLATLRETARLNSTHYSTAIEGNRLTREQVTGVLKHDGHFPGRERDEREILGYYAALEKMEGFAADAGPVAESQIQSIHATLMAGGKSRVKGTPYRDGQNVIRDGSSGKIVYMPPEAGDVPILMKQLVSWINQSTTGNERR